MTTQELADELNALRPSPIGRDAYLGSLDALEAFRREKLPDFRWSSVEWDKFGVRARGFLRVARLVSTEAHPDEWTARATALVEAAREVPR